MRGLFRLAEQTPQACGWTSAIGWAHRAGDSEQRRRRARPQALPRCGGEALVRADGVAGDGVARPPGVPDDGDMSPMDAAGRVRRVLEDEPGRRTDTLTADDPQAHPLLLRRASRAQARPPDQAEIEAESEPGLARPPISRGHQVPLPAGAADQEVEHRPGSRLGAPRLEVDQIGARRIPVTPRGLEATAGQEVGAQHLHRHVTGCAATAFGEHRGGRLCPGGDGSGRRRPGDHLRVPAPAAARECSRHEEPEDRRSDRHTAHRDDQRAGVEHRAPRVGPGGPTRSGCQCARPLSAVKRSSW